MLEKGKLKIRLMKILPQLMETVFSRWFAISHNCTLNENTATSDGGGIYNGPGTLNFTNTIIANSNGED